MTVKQLARPPRRGIATYQFVALLIAALVAFIGWRTVVIAAPSNPGISLEQCRNGAADTPNDCEVLGGGVGWVNGNAGASQAHFREGYSIPYRAIATNVPAGPVTLTLGYDITHGGGHAIDFLTHYDRLEPHAQFGHPAEAIDPIDGFGPYGAPATCAISLPSNLSGTDAGDTFTNLTAGEKLFTVWGASACSVAEGDAGDINADNSEATVDVTFTATSSTVILAWGGHIALGGDWDGNSASSISGSPYHMRVLDWTLGNIGNQDRSLAAAAVVAVETSVSTDIHNASEGSVTSVSVGTTVHDSATVDGASSGDVEFYWFTNGTCTDPKEATSSTFPINGSGYADGTTFTQTPTTAGDYAFQAKYLGNENFEPALSPCEPLSVTKIDPTVATDIHNGSDEVVTSVDVGTTVHDKATVTGTVGTPTGTVTFEWFTNGTCTDPAADTSSSFALSGGIVDATTFTKTPTTSGSYAFQATYSGNGSYNSKVGPCEPLTVNKIDPSVSTDIHNGSDAVVTSVDAGTTVHDKATVTGTVGTPTGTVTFEWFTNGTCAPSAADTSSSFALSGGIVDATTFTQTPNTSGSYAFRATYSGDGAYNSKVGPCEPLTVNKVDPTVATDIHDDSDHSVVTSVVVGTTVHDQATVSGSVITPTGTVTFSWFTNGTCSETADSTSLTFNLNGSGIADGTTFTKTPTTAGNYAFQASYSGDSTYNSKVGPCEPLTVTLQTPGFSTTPTVQIKDTVIVSGYGTPAGTVDFRLYKDSATCEAGALVFTDLGVSLVSGTATSSYYTVAMDATYYWQVGYTSTDSSNASGTSSCAEATVIDLP
jgi:hypothetical protein